MKLSEDIADYDMKLPADLSIKNFGSCVSYLRYALPEWATRATQLEAYCDKLADGLPEGMLPKDVEVLQNANAEFAKQLAQLEAENDRYLEALRSIAGTNTKPSHLKYAWKEMMLAAKQRAKEALGGER